jgi:hypothetical protein
MVHVLGGGIALFSVALFSGALCVQPAIVLHSSMSCPSPLHSPTVTMAPADSVAMTMLMRFPCCIWLEPEGVRTGGGWGGGRGDKLQSNRGNSNHSGCYLNRAERGGGGAGGEEGRWRGHNGRVG